MFTKPKNFVRASRGTHLISFNQLLTTSRLREAKMIKANPLPITHKIQITAIVWICSHVGTIRRLWEVGEVRTQEVWVTSMCPEVNGISFPYHLPDAPPWHFTLPTDQSNRLFNQMATSKLWPRISFLFTCYISSSCHCNHKMVYTKVYEEIRTPLSFGRMKARHIQDS